MEKITPELLHKIYHNEGYVICPNIDCGKKIMGVYLRDYCGCKHCSTGSDDLCVVFPLFTKYEIVCPFCGIAINNTNRRS